MANAMRVTDSAPRADDFVELQTHQEQTPDSFFGGKAVLHHRIASAALTLPADQFTASAALSALHPAGLDDPAATDVTIPDLAVWVASDYFILWSARAAKGLQIPYPTISLHARQQTALYMQLCLSDLSQTADDDIDTLELLLQPDHSTTDAAELLYAAVSACADLHPDPDDQDDDDLAQEPQPEPGAGGWITSENLQDFMDEHGNFRMPQGALGAGAGSIRTADQFQDADDDREPVNGESESEETKWRRTG